MQFNFIKIIKNALKISLFLLPFLAQAAICQGSPCICKPGENCTVPLPAYMNRNDISIENFAKNKTYVCAFTNVKCNDQGNIEKLSITQLLRYPKNLKYQVYNSNMKLVDNKITINTQNINPEGASLLLAILNNNVSQNCEATISCSNG